MITLIIVSLITALFYLLWRNEHGAIPSDQGTASGKLPLWLLLGVMSVLALLSPKLRDKIKDLRKKGAG